MSVNGATLEVAKASFLEMLRQLGGDMERRIFLDWIGNEICGQVPSGYGKIADSENNYESVIDSRQILTRVSDYVRDQCVVEAASQGATSNGSVWSSESLHYPAKFSVGGDADPGLTASNTVHLDGFLYDEVDEQAMIDSGSLSRAYCKGILQY